MSTKKGNFRARTLKPGLKFSTKITRRAKGEDGMSVKRKRQLTAQAHRTIDAKRKELATAPKP